MTPATLAVARRARALRASLNAPLVIGGLLVVTLLVAAIFAPLLTPADPGAVQIQFDAAGNFLPPPYPPGTPGMPLGSDTLGRDMLSRLLYGSRYTLAICGIAALVRVMLGALLGVSSGWGSRRGTALNVVVGASSAVPSLFFALIPVAAVNRPNVVASVAVFLIAISLTGWAETAVRTRTAVQSLSRSAFVEAAHALGLRPRAVLRRHILPNLRDLLLVESTFAIASAMLLVAELGFLNFFIGDAEIDVVGATVNVDPILAEWGGMLAKGLRDRSYGIWLLIEPVLAFTIAILAFNLLAEGLRRRR